LVLLRIILAAKKLGRQNDIDCIKSSINLFSKKKYGLQNLSGCKAPLQEQKLAQKDYNHECL
jgi:hypothetical protein